MKREMNEMDELFKRDLPSASKEVVEADGARVLNRLRTHRDELPKLNVELEFSRTSYGRSAWGWRLGLIAVAAAIVLAVFLKMPGGAPAVLEDVLGSRRIEFGEVVRSGVLTLADSSRVEIRSNSEFLLERADDGVRIHMRKGNVLVTAAKQRDGHLYVQTKDLTVSVVGTVFWVSVEEEGSQVAVIEGEVRAKWGTSATILRKGEQLTTNPNMKMTQLAALQQGQQPARPQTRTAPPPNVVGDYTAEVLPPGRRPAETPPPPPSPVRPVRPGEVPKWDAVSIRPCPPLPTGGGVRGDGGGRDGGGDLTPYRFSSDRMTLNCLNVRSLIRSAYHTYLELNRPGAPARTGVLISGMRGGRAGKDPTDGTDGGPDWLDTEYYRIEAKAEVVADQALMQGPMLQAILEDRFKIKVHKETREIAVNALVVAKDGPKLKPFVEGSCVRSGPEVRSGGPQTVKLHIRAEANGKLSGTMESRGETHPLTTVRVEGQSLILGFPEGGGGDGKASIEDNGARLTVVVPTQPGGPAQPPIVFTRDTAQTQSQPASQRYCRLEEGGLNLNNNRKPVNYLYDAEGLTIDEFAKFLLTPYRGRYVIDKTGLSGKFDIHLEEEISPETRQRMDPNGDFFNPSTAPPLPQALEKQLGLKLESMKGLVELLVIDRIDRPSEN